MENIIKKAEEVAKECKEYLIEHLNEFELDNVDTHYNTYLINIGDRKHAINIWTANGKESAKFYDCVPVLKLNYIEYTPEEQEKLWNKTEADKKREGEKRNITMSQLSNDLYFSFKGVFGQVKFSGYNDNDWWTKYKPTEIKETDEIIWQIDLDKNIATYKPRK